VPFPVQKFRHSRQQEVEAQKASTHQNEDPLDYGSGLSGLHHSSYPLRIGMG